MYLSRVEYDLKLCNLKYNVSYVPLLNYQPHVYYLPTQIK